MTRSTNKTETVPLDALATVATPEDFTGVGVFAVRDNVSFVAALDAMHLLLGTSRSATRDLAQALDRGDGERFDGGSAWAVEHLLGLAQALALAMASGLRQAQDLRVV